ncbi:MAG: DNA polymerase III subunit gamma/tau [Ruminococcus sp.]|nr:DNA polymerase III subunit gamma/tau [Ruminococcus sp.]
MYQVLYRKWRPKKFSDVSGQPQVTRTLENELKSGRINHAYLFTGSRGTGKTTCAKILAKAVNCLNPQDGNPCCECENCKGIDDGSILDVVEMDAASNRGIDDIRAVIDEAQFRPARGKYRVYIIDEVHMLTDQAFNALLKTLEEPPEHVVFILATTEVHKLPSTILSRCQRFDFNRISPEDIKNRLKFVAENENASIDDDAALLIAAIADGAMRDALSLMDRCLGTSTHITSEIVRNSAGLARKDYLFELSTACINKNTAKALEVLSRLHRESKDMARLCDELLDHFRSLMMIKCTRNPLSHIVMSSDEFEMAQTQSDYLTLGEIVYIMDILQNTYQRMGKGNSNKTELEMALVKLSAPELEGTNEALTARVSALEKALKSGITVKAEKSELKTEIKQPETKTADKAKPEAKEETPKPPKMVDIPKPQEELPPPPSEPSVAEAETVKAEKPQPPKNKVNFDELYNNAKPFREWPEVIENIKKYSKGIAAAFSNTNAYESGNYLLIDAQSEIPFRLLREGSQRANVKKAVQEVTGKMYNLGPYKKPEKKEEKKDPLNDFVNNLRESDIKLTEE